MINIALRVDSPTPAYEAGRLGSIPSRAAKLFTRLAERQMHYSYKVD
ncbi:MAG: hypothetical protein GOVbin1096_85 [Prokaryotic dsDNA virus sp.]|nr:MAG: hypothetical protein GOVbin1096_85 [Prokaryotic dsDNA virus sp.]